MAAGASFRDARSTRKKASFAPRRGLERLTRHRAKGTSVSGARAKQLLCCLMNPLWWDTELHTNHQSYCETKLLLFSEDRASIDLGVGWIVPWSPKFLDPDHETSEVVHDEAHMKIYKRD